MVIDKGVYTQFTVTVTDEQMEEYSAIVFTLKAKVGGEPVAVRTYTEAGTYLEEITPEEAEQLNRTAVYDFDGILLEGGHRVKISENQYATVTQGVGDVNDRHSD